MDNSNYSRNRHNEHLGVNKLGKNIRKSPLHQPNFGNNSNNNKPQPPQPHVYNISKNDFRNIVQQLTGSPSQNLPPPRPPSNPPKPPSMRLQKIRPPPLTPINRPPQIPHQPVIAPPPHFNGNFARPGQFGQPPILSPLIPGDTTWANTAESPISAYMRYLQEQSPRPPQAPPQGSQPHPQFQSHVQPHQPFTGLLPTPPGPSAFPSPRGNGPALLPSPTSPFPLPSPSTFMGLLSPRSPYPPFSPGFQYPPLTPSFFSPLSQSGILGPGPQPPLSPGAFFPPSPSGYYPLSSPRWRGQ